MSMTLPFFADPAVDFVARTAVGHAAMGTSDIGPVLETLARCTDDDPAGWYRAWHEQADRFRAAAVDARAAGRRTTAAALFLAASEFYDQSLAFVDALPDPDAVLLPTFRAHRGAWDDFVAASDGRHLPVDIAFEGGTLPGYLFRPDGSGVPRPTLVVTNGSDGALSGLWATAIRPALDRGWNAYVFDGPGQQSLLFERGIPFRHDWEAVLTPVVDALVARPDVDADALLAYAISQGGYWLPRALAFEHRFVAAVVDGGVVDVTRAWNANLPPAMLALLEAGERDRFNALMAAGPADPKQAAVFAFRAKPYGGTTPYDVFAAVQKFTLDGLVEKIRTPLLITDPDAEEFFAGQSKELHDALPGEKLLVRFTREQGADHHCEPMARGLTGAVMTDFLAAHLP
ncbi:MAG: alpha/beta hydrolase family protein [Pseudonocardia sp.]